MHVSLVNVKKKKKPFVQRDEVLKDNPHSKNSTSRKKTALQHLESLEKREQDYNELKKDFDHEVPLAASLFIMYGKEIIYLTSGSYDQYKRFKGPYALQWYMIQKQLMKVILCITSMVSVDTLKKIKMALVYLISSVDLTQKLLN